MERFTRRTVFGLIVGAAAFPLIESNPGIALASDLAPAVPARQILTAPVYAQILNPLDAIKKMASEQGNRPLTIPKAKEVVKLGADWVATRKDGILPNPQLLQSGTFALSYGTKQPKPIFRPDGDPLRHPVVLNHYENYPDYPFPLSELEARRLLGFYYDPYFGQVAWGAHQSFINLDNTNTGISNNPDFKPNTHQYLGTEAFPAGVPVIPFDAFRSVKQHEDFHLDGDFAGMQPLDPEIALYIERQTGRNSGVTYDGLINNFGVNIIPPEQEVQEYKKLNELITDRLAGYLSQEAGLPWWMAYERQPVDHYNLRMVFEQAGITFADLSRMYKNGLLQEFYTRIAEGAQGNLFTPSSPIQAKLDLAIPRFPWDDFPVWNPEKDNPKKPNIIRFFPGIEMPRAA